MQVSKEKLIELTYVAIREFELNQLTQIVFEKMISQIELKLQLENYKSEEISGLISLVEADLKKDIEKTLSQKYEPYKFKQLVSEHFIDSVLQQEFNLNYNSSYADFLNIIKEIDKMEERHVPKKAYFKYLRKWVKDIYTLTDSERLKILDKIDKKISN